MKSLLIHILDGAHFPEAWNYLGVFFGLPISMLFLILAFLGLWMVVVALAAWAKLSIHGVALATYFATVLLLFALWGALRFILRLANYRTILKLEHISDSHGSTAIVGNKAWQLARMLKAGEPVLPGFVITALAFKRYVSQNRIDLTNQAGKHLAGTPLPLAMAGKIAKKCRKMGFDRLILRSSFAEEDEALHSFAGIFRSEFNVRSDSREEIAKGLLSIWGSYWSQTAEVYRTTLGIRSDPSPNLAVLIQPFLKPVLIGTASNVDPSEEREDRFLVEIQWPKYGRASVSMLDRSVYIHCPNREMEKAASNAADWAFDLLARNEAGQPGPCQIEWALDGAGNHILLQIRPLTLTPSCSIYSNSAVADLIAYPLTPLSRDAIDFENSFREVILENTGKRLSADSVVKEFHGRLYFRFGAVRSLLNPYSTSMRSDLGWLKSILASYFSASRYKSATYKTLDQTLDGKNLMLAARKLIEGSLLPLIRKQARWGFAAGTLIHTLRSLSGSEKTPAARHLPKATETSPGIFAIEEAEISGLLNSPESSAIAKPRRTFFKHDLLDRFPPVKENVSFPLRRIVARLFIFVFDSVENAREAAKVEIREINLRLAHLFELAAAALKIDPRDIYFYRLRELEVLADGGPALSPQTIASRRSEYERDREIDLCPVLSVDREGRIVPMQSDPSRQRKGFGLGGGKTRGRILNLHPKNPISPEEVDSGRVLLVPDGRAFWLSYLPRAAGAIIASGSVLSHLAVSGSELGAPMVLFPEGFSAPDGADVEIDGLEGTCEIG